MRNGRDRRLGEPVMGHARLERVLLFGTRSADCIRAGGCIATEVILRETRGRIHDALERFADNQIPLAPRAPRRVDPAALVLLGIGYLGLTSIASRRFRPPCNPPIPFGAPRGRAISSAPVALAMVSSSLILRCCP